MPSCRHGVSAMRCAARFFASARRRSWHLVCSPSPRRLFRQETMVQSRGFIGRCAASKMTTLRDNMRRRSFRCSRPVRLLMSRSSNGELTIDKRHKCAAAMELAGVSRAAGREHHNRYPLRDTVVEARHDAGRRVARYAGFRKNSNCDSRALVATW